MNADFLFSFLFIIEIAWLLWISKPITMKLFQQWSENENEKSALIELLNWLWTFFTGS